MGQQHTIGKCATKVVHNNEKLSVTYHRTEVVHVDYATGTVTLNTGGWESATTKSRMNQASNEYRLGYSVCQFKHVWYCHKPDGQVVEFTGNIVQFQW